MIITYNELTHETNLEENKFYMIKRHNDNILIDYIVSIDYNTFDYTPRIVAISIMSNERLFISRSGISGLLFHPLDGTPAHSDYRTLTSLDKIVNKKMYNLLKSTVKRAEGLDTKELERLVGEINEGKNNKIEEGTYP